MRVLAPDEGQLNSRQCSTGPHPARSEPPSPFGRGTFLSERNIFLVAWVVLLFLPGCSKGTPSGAGGPHNLGEWFNIACFVPPGHDPNNPTTGFPNGWAFGTESRVDPSLRQAGANNWDFAVFKRTYFGPDDRLNLEFRTEFFNIFNRTQFGPPNGTCCNVGNFTNGTSFGIVSNTVGNPRLIQFGFKFAF